MTLGFTPGYTTRVYFRGLSKSVGIQVCSKGRVRGLDIEAFPGLIPFSCRNSYKFNDIDAPSSIHKNIHTSCANNFSP